MRALILVAWLLAGIGSSNALAVDKKVDKKVDKYVGAIWRVKVKNDTTGKYVDYGRIRCTTDGKVYRDGRVVGSHKNTNRNHIVMKLTSAKDPTKVNGTWKASRVKKDGGVWEGVFTRESDGKEFSIVMVLEAD